MFGTNKGFLSSNVEFIMIVIAHSSFEWTKYKTFRNAPDEV